MFVVTAFIGDPYLDLIDLRTAGDVRHILHCLLVMLAEEMGEEEMAVLIIGVTADVEFRCLRTALTAHRLRLAVLLRDEGLDLEFTELEVRFDTKERLAASDEGGRQIHRDVTRLDGLDDVVLFAFVVQFEVLLVKGERCLGIIG